jgi:hypothetical protein
MGASAESVTDEDDSERRSLASGRRGSKLIDILDTKKKRPPIKYKDKQGFVWRRMVHDSDDFLHTSRTPHLGQGANSIIPSESLSSLTTMQQSQRLPNLTSISDYQRKLSALSNHNHPIVSELDESTKFDSTSMTSFKTCPSDPNLNSLVPKQVSDTYGTGKVPLPLLVTTRPPNERARSSSEIRRSKTGSTPPALTSTDSQSQENVIQGVKHLVRDR